MLRQVASRSSQSLWHAAGGQASAWGARRFAGGKVDAGDTHPDFQPVNKASTAEQSVHDFIAKDVAANDILVFMKGTPAMPQCGFSNIVCRVLDGYGVKYASRNVLEDPELRQGVKSFTAWPTIPQVFVAGEFVGGSDILMGMHNSGELEKLLQKVKAKAAK